MARLATILFLLFVPCFVAAEEPDLFESIRSWDASAQVLSAERLSSGEYLVDVWRGDVRHPVKVGDGGVVWQPVPEYITALHSIIKSGTLPNARGTTWRTQPRTPAFPIIITRARVITPFGGMTLVGDSLQVQDALVRHAKRWLFEVTKQEQSLGQMDLIVDSEASVLDLMQVLFSTYEIGYFRLNFILGQTQELNVLEAFSPVLLSALPADSVSVLGVYPLSDTLGFRILEGSRQPTKTCPEGNEELGLTFCAKDLSELRQELEQGPLLRQVIVIGLGPEVRLGKAIEILEMATGLSKRPPVINLVVP